MPRVAIERTDLTLPTPPIPRLGDRVTWFVGGTRHRGIFKGCNIDAIPAVINDLGNPTQLESMSQIRVENPFDRKGPMWMELPENSLFIAPTDRERNDFSRLLSRFTPPGLTYRDLVEEIHFRGFEVFVVGGTVRDVIRNSPAHDVDLVTTMPFALAELLLRDMYRDEPSIARENGFVRLGGTPASGDPFTDLKMFCLDGMGTQVALFGGDFLIDVGHRDFACNSIYYDPINECLIDPTGIGVADAEANSLSIVCDRNRRNPYFQAQVVIRAIKFIGRGYTMSADTCALLKNSFAPALPAMTHATMISYMRKQVLSKSPIEQHVGVIENIKVKVFEYGMQDIWDTHLEPIVPEVLNAH